MIYHISYSIYHIAYSIYHDYIRYQISYLPVTSTVMPVLPFSVDKSFPPSKDCGHASPQIGTSPTPPLALAESRG